MHKQRKDSFDQAFPRIEDLIVEVEETGHIGSHFSKKGPKLIYTEQSPPDDFINCSNPMCQNGGLSILSILLKMVANRQRALETSEKCSGYERSPRGSRSSKPCWNFFHVKVSIKYKEA